MAADITPTEVPVWYIQKVLEAQVLPDSGGYNLYYGEMNPAIFDAFMRECFSEPGSVLWEPFAGHTRKNWTMRRAVDYRHRLIAYDIHPCEDVVVRADSTRTGPPEPVDGVLFHPPYYTTDAMSGEPGELAMCATLPDYIEALGRAVRVTVGSLKPCGCVCAVNRSVHLFQEWLNLDWYTVDLFLRAGLTMRRIMKSTPDVVVFLEKD